MRKEFFYILKEATKKIDANYFKTEIMHINGKKAVYRERVYCYELYHQMRKAWPDDPGDPTLILHGDYDKSGSQLFSGSTVKGAKPDFLVHIPANEESNLVAIEVKSSNVRRKDIKKDLDKLSVFVNELKYKFGLFLIYGDKAKIKAELASSMLPSSQKHLEIWFHEKPMVCAEVFKEFADGNRTADGQCLIA